MNLTELHAAFYTLSLQCCWSRLSTWTNLWVGISGHTIPSLIWATRLLILEYCTEATVDIIWSTVIGLMLWLTWFDWQRCAIIPLQPVIPSYEKHTGHLYFKRTSCTLVLLPAAIYVHIILILLFQNYGVLNKQLHCWFCLQHQIQLSRQIF